MSSDVKQADQQSQKTAQKSNKSNVDRAQMLQQREQLRQMVIQRLINDYGKGKQRNNQVITDIVNDYFQSQKVTDASLKVLKQQVQEALSGVSEKRSMVSKSNAKSITNENPSSLSKPPHPPNEAKADRPGSDQKTQLKPVKPPTKPLSRGSNSVKDDQSVHSSKAPRSVYMIDGDEDDEWATLVKFDTELFKKEQELERIRQLEFKKKIKSELDKQLEEKKEKKVDEQKDEVAYVNLADYQRNVYDQREHDKAETLKKKIHVEKLQRDKQVRDEYQRRKIEQKREKELDDLLVKKIKEELELEQQEQQMRRNKERERLLRMMKENEEYRKKALEDAKQEKIAETMMQQQYINLQNQLEEQRENEKKDREEKMKKVMGMYAESVVRDQKEIIRQEDEKMLKNILDQNERERFEDEKRKQRISEQKTQMRQYLNAQIEEKHRKEIEEQELNKRQAQIWQQDLTNFNDHEKKKHDYIKEVNLRHAEILKSQMMEKEMKKKTRSYKMNTIELLQNKNKLKEIAQNNPEIGEKVKKVEINAEIPQ